MVRESGYAGFALFVDIYFKSKLESSKVRFEYQLTLPEVGPPISNKIREEYVFNNPPEEFRRKLIRGGGVSILLYTLNFNSYHKFRKINEPL